MSPTRVNKTFLVSAWHRWHRL